MNYNKYLFIWINFVNFYEGGFDSKFLKNKKLILALKYAHIARHSRFKAR